jgi:hypothetical protein
LTTVSVKELIEAYLAKNRSRTALNRNTPVPSKAPSSSVSVISVPRPKVLGPSPVSSREIERDVTE